MVGLLSWFDFVTVIMVALGIWVGRRRGMSSELLDMLLWLAIVVVGALVTPSVGGWIGRTVGFAPATSFILGYLSLAGALFFLVFLVRRGVGEKLISSDAFGSFEYYLGMGAGVIRFLCILLATLALLHAPRISQEELDRRIKVQKEDLGSIYFPPFGQIQRGIFEGSITGRTVKEHLSVALLTPKRSAGARSGENIYRARERLVDDAGALR
jgi:uncharacterized membrane protein required for colicin V production